MHKIYNAPYYQAVLLSNYTRTQLSKNIQHRQRHLQMKYVMEQILALTEI